MFINVFQNFELSLPLYKHTFLYVQGILSHITVILQSYYNHISTKVSGILPNICLIRVTYATVNFYNINKDILETLIYIGLL